jgi:hypothetical protein
LKAGEWFRRGRLLMVSPVHGDYRRYQAETPLIALSKFPRPALSILEAIENALSAAEQERSGLTRRVEDALARAAVTIGNGTDEYLERDALDSHHQDLFSTEISNGQRRLEELATEITHFKFLKAAALSRFPDFKPLSSKS